MLRISRFSVLLLVVCLFLGLIASAAVAGGEGDGQKVWLGVQGLPGYEGVTSSYLRGEIMPPFYENGEGDVPFEAPLHSDYFTVAYWVNDSQKLSTQALAHPYPSGNFQWEGVIDVGVNDTRAYQTIDWFVDNYDSDFTWLVQMYRKDNHSLVFRETVEAHNPNNWFSYTVLTSHEGYDILAAAWIDSPTVPEPCSLLVMLSGLAGLVGFGRRRRK